MVNQKQKKRAPAPPPRRKAAPRQGMNNPVPRMTIQPRNFDQLIPETIILSLSGAPEDSQLGVGSYYANVGIDYSLRNFITGSSGLFTTMDQYRFQEIEIWALSDSNTTYRPILITCSVDFDDAVAPTWYTMSQRNNTHTVAITTFKPMVKLAAFRPVGNFVTGGTDSPSNIVPNPSAWWDMANPNQLFNGLKLSIATQSTSSSVRILAKARIEMRGKI